MEGYLLGGRNIPQSLFEENFQKIYGREELQSFKKNFQNNFITEEDFLKISSWGVNTVRIPFSYKILEKAPFKYSSEGVRLFKKILRWAKKYNLYIILDLHAAAGSQNKDWHSDSKGRALFWDKKSYQERTILLWEYIASSLKNSEYLLGYDILNEPVLEKNRISLLKNFYKKVIRKLRIIDKQRIIFLEGNIWAQEIRFLEELLQENVKISIHTYQPLNFTFNFRPQYRYPGQIDGVRWNKDTLRKYLYKYKKFSEKNKVDIYVGEFGINYRGGIWGELNWLKDILSLFEEYRFSWTYWTYKAVANSVFPDGVVQYLNNPTWIRREGPVTGWENFYTIWRKNKKQIISSWKTRHFSENKDLLEILKSFWKKKVTFSAI